MVKIGEVYWSAAVRGEGKAAAAAADLRGGMNGVAEAASNAADEQNRYSSRAGDATEATEGATRWTGRLRTGQSLLASALYFTGNQLGITTAATKAYAIATLGAAGATTLLTTSMKGARVAAAATAGVLGGLAAAAMGPAGVAGGLFAAVGAVGLLGSELLGLTDYTSVAEADMYSMAGAFADVAYLVGGPLVGYMIAGWDLLNGDFEGAKNRFINTSVEWVKASARFAARVRSGFAAAGVAVRTGLESGVEAADYAWRSGLNSLIAATNGVTQKIASGMIGGLERAANGALGVINGLIIRANRVPGINLSTVGRVRMSRPDVPRLGQLQNEALDSRLGRVRDRNRRRLSGVQERGRRQIAEFAPDTIGGDRRTAGAGGSTTIQQENNVQIGDQSMNLSTMNRSERKELARLIGRELGTSTTNIAGGK